MSTTLNNGINSVKFSSVIPYAIFQVYDCDDDECMGLSIVVTSFQLSTLLLLF